MINTLYIWAAEIEVIGPSGAIEWLRVCDTPMRPFRHDDGERPNVKFDARMVASPNYETAYAINVGGGRSGGAGALELSNADGGLSYLRGYAFRRVTVKRGYEQLPWGNWSTLLDGVAAAPDWTLGAGRPGRLTLPIYDRREALAGEILTAAYAGSGGVEGPAEMTGVKKPLALGDLTTCNVTPVWLSATPQIAQLSTGSMQALTGIFDRGDAMGLASDGDKAGGAFDAWTPAPGRMVTDFSRGLLKINANPGGTITIGMRGLTAAGDSWASILAWALSQAGQTVGPELAALAAPAAVGVMVDDGMTWAGLLDLLTASGGGWCVPDAGGVWRAGYLRRPAGAPVLAFGEREIADIAVDAADIGRPAHKVTIKGRRNYTTMGRADIAASLWGGGREAELKEDYRSAVASNAALKSRFGEAARELTIETALASTADMEALAARLLDLYGPRSDGSPPQSLRVVVPLSAATLALCLGDEVHLSYGREGIDDDFVVYGIIPASPRRNLMTLKVFR